MQHCCVTIVRPFTKGHIEINREWIDIISVWILIVLVCDDRIERHYSLLSLGGIVRRLNMANAAWW